MASGLREAFHWAAVSVAPSVASTRVTGCPGQWEAMPERTWSPVQDVLLKGATGHRSWARARLITRTSIGFLLPFDQR